MCVCVLVAQSCQTVCDPMDCSLPPSSVHGILQARVLEWAACPPPGDLRDPGIEPRSPALQADALPSELLLDTWNYSLRIWSSSESLRYLLLKLPSFLWRLLYSRAWLSESSAPFLHSPKFEQSRLWISCETCVIQMLSEVFWRCFYFSHWPDVDVKKI